MKKQCVKLLLGAWIGLTCTEHVWAQTRSARSSRTMERAGERQGLERGVGSREAQADRASQAAKERYRQAIINQARQINHSSLRDRSVSSLVPGASTLTPEQQADLRRRLMDSQESSTDEGSVKAEIINKIIEDALSLDSITQTDMTTGVEEWLNSEEVQSFETSHLAVFDSVVVDATDLARQDAADGVVTLTSQELFGQALEQRGIELLDVRNDCPVLTLSLGI